MQHHSLNLQHLSYTGTEGLHLLCQLFNEDEGANEHVGILDVSLEGLQGGGGAQLLQQIPHNFKAHLRMALVLCMLCSTGPRYPAQHHPSGA